MKTDRQLVDEINRRDPDAFETLYRRYRNWVLALARRFTGSGEQAQDVLQEAFLYLLKKFPGFQLRCSMKTFLYPAVLHISITIARQSRKTVSDEAAINELPAPDCQRSDTQAELAIVLAQLPGEQRQIVLMRFVDDMSLDEIAQALDTPLSTVKSRLYRALEILRNDPATKKYFEL